MWVSVICSSISDQMAAAAYAIGRKPTNGLFFDLGFFFIINATSLVFVNNRDAEYLFL